MNYGLALMKKGDYANAEKYFEEAMKFVPNYANLHVNMGILKNATGRGGEAEPYFGERSSSIRTGRGAITGMHSS
ncbi:MAG: tetratricopeptide repeat protein [Comamonadaceae bacterium]|nr:tetratricopeptide repeat protein [Comamonadaceae bacterium]